MKRIVHLLLVILLLAGLCITASAAERAVYSGSCGTKVTWELAKETGVLTISGSGNMYNYGEGITEPWYDYRSDITSVVVKKGVTGIGNNAFMGCSNLTDVTLPYGVTRIGMNAFHSCSKLPKITLPNGLTELGQGVFYGCESLEKIVIPEGVTSIGWSTFENCKSLTSVTIPDSVATIGSWAFENCTMLKTVKLGSGLKKIEYRAFSNCNALEEIDLPGGLKTIEHYAFSGCSALTGITIPKGVTQIPERAFEGCSSVTYVALPEGLTQIGEYAFVGCSALTELNLPESLTEIGAGAFSSCQSIKTVVIPDGISEIPDNAFYGCRDLRSVTLPDGLKRIGNSAFSECVVMRNVTIPSTVTDIGEYAFGNCDRLTKVTIPEGVTEVRDYTFQGCDNLAEVLIPEGVTRIGANAFYDTGLKKVTIPKTVTTIGNNAFYSCDVLASVSLSTGLKRIGEEAFRYCYALKTIKLPRTITEIGKNAFYCCRNLEAFHVDSENSYFSAVDGVLFNKRGTQLRLYPAGGKTEYVIPDGVTSIRDGAFTGSSLRDLTIPGSVAYIEDDLFQDFTDLNSVTLLEGITGIGWDAFYNCHKLTRIGLPSTLEEIGDWAFHGCYSLEEVRYAGTDAQKAKLYIGEGNEYLTKQNWIRWLNHDHPYGDWFYTSKPTYYEDGMERRECKTCKAYEERVAPILDVPAPVVAMSVKSATGKPVLKWEGIDANACYRVYRSTSESSGFKYLKSSYRNYFVDTSAEIGTKYYYKVLTVVTTHLGERKSSFSNTVSHFVKLGKPVFEVVPDLNSVDQPAFRWDAVEEAERYYVYRSQKKNSGFTRIASVTTTYYRDDSAEPGEIYYYKIKAIHSNASANSEYSSVVRRDGPKLGQPWYIMAENAADPRGKPEISWWYVENAVKYYVYRSQQKDSGYIRVGSTTNSSYRDNSAVPGETYYYKVKAIHSNPAMNSDYSDVVQIECRIVKLEKPVITVSNAADPSGKPVISWGAVMDAVEYYVYRSQERSSGYTRIGSSTGTSYLDDSAMPGDRFYYRIKAIHSNTAMNSDYSSAQRVTCIMPMTEMTVSVNETTGNPVVNWKSVEGEIGFYVYRSTSKDQGFNVCYTAGVGETSWEDVNAIPGYRYYYKVQTRGENTNSVPTSAQSGFCVLAKPEVSISYSSTSGKSIVKWNTVEGAAKYRVYRSTKKTSGFELVYTGVSARSYTDTTAKAGINYYYKVMAVHTKSSANSAYSEVVNRVCDLEKPVVEITLKSGDPRLTWEKISGAKKYEVWRATSKDGTYEKVKTTTSSAFTDTTAKAKTKYYYKVRAIHENTSANSSYSSIKYITVK